MKRVGCPAFPRLALQRVAQRIARRHFRLLILAGLLLLLLRISASLWLPFISRGLVIPGNEHEADAIAVFGGNQARTKRALKLYRQGMAPQIWQTGWQYADDSSNDAATAYQELQKTVSEDARHIVSTTSTWEDAQVIARLAREHNIQRMLVVTDQLHSRRALCSLRHHLDDTSDIAISYSPVLVKTSDNERALDTWWQNPRIRRQVLNEYLKLGYYLLRYGVVPWGC